MNKFFLAIALFSSVGLFAEAQVDTVNALNNKLQLNYLKAGTSNYLVYFIDTAETKRTNGDIWQRSTSFKKIKNKQVVAFNWKWLRSDTLFASVTNICDAKTLAPIYHYANYKGKGIIAYDYTADFMIPTDTVKNNMAVKKGKVALTIPVISWEQDLETYPTLPIKKVGQKFDISFFDPNEKAPSYHRYEVIGKEDLALNSEVNVKCWLLKINYNADTWAIFWLTEKNRQVVKMKEYFKGQYRIKVLQY
ncbi:MAG: hypothetical protein EOP00_12055 [Pedobacter sp.]|nr:MAG: hypothetical protein EOP00_12055 [Pedobacter sp.]